MHDNMYVEILELLLSVNKMSRWI